MLGWEGAVTAEEEPERDVPGGPEDRILCSHCRGSRFKPWLGIIRSHIPHDKTKKKKKKTLKTTDKYTNKKPLWGEKKGQRDATLVAVRMEEGLGTNDCGNLWKLEKVKSFL